MKLYAAPLQGFTEAPWRNSSSGSFWWNRCVLYSFCTNGERRSSVTGMYGTLLPKTIRFPMLVPQLIASTPVELERLAGFVYRERI